VKSENGPETISKVFNSTGIDMLKLRKTKDWPTILRMMRVSNDITLSPGVAFLVSFRPPSAHLDVLNNGLHWHFVRWNAAVASEALTIVIDPLRKHINDKDHGIWNVIRERQSLNERWRLLEEYLSEKDHWKHLKSAKTIRDKLMAHYDNAPINKAFNDLLNLHEQAGHDVVLGWHMQSSNDGGVLTRNNMVDQLLNIAWFQTYGIEPTIAGPDSESIEKVAKSIEEFLSLTSNFFHGVVLAYCEQHDLINSDGEPPWYLKERMLQGEK